MTHLNDFKEDQVKKVSYIPVFYYVRMEYHASVLDVLSLEGIIAFLGGFVPSI